MLLLRYILLASLVTLCYASNAQSGCTDPNAPNYDPGATINDGSCNYGNTNYTPALKTLLSDTVQETSGLMYWDGLLWTHNDSGGSTDLFAVDTANGTIVRKVTVSGVSNVDWEDIARDEEYGYIGDFGNNNGTRTDLKIYKFALEDLEEESLTAEVISFNYPDQADFSSRPQNHNFDAEALIAYGDSLCIFSKNWANQRTKLYVLPKTPGNYSARLGGDIFAGGLITGADVNIEDSVVLLTAYTKLLQPYFWLLWDFSEGDVFGGNKRKITLNLPLHQVEGGAWMGDGRYFISNEKLTTLGNVAPALHVINTADWVSEVVSGIFPARSFLGHLQVFPNPSAGLVFVSWYDKSLSVSEIELADMTGRIVGRQQMLPGATQGQLDMTGVAAGNYTIIVRTKEGVFTDRVVYAPYSTK